MCCKGGSREDNEGPVPGTKVTLTVCAETFKLTNNCVPKDLGLAPANSIHLQVV